MLGFTAKELFLDNYELKREDNIMKLTIDKDINDDSIKYLRIISVGESWNGKEYTFNIPDYNQKKVINYLNKMCLPHITKMVKNVEFLR